MHSSIKTLKGKLLNHFKTTGAGTAPVTAAEQSAIQLPGLIDRGSPHLKLSPGRLGSPWPGSSGHLPTMWWRWKRLRVPR